jgi:acetyl esterase
MKAILLSLFLVAPLFAKPVARLGDAIIYKKVEGEDKHLYVIKPDGAKSSQKRPAIVWYYGGGWVGGTPTQFKDQAEYFAKLGVVSFLIEYSHLKDNTSPPVLPCRDAKSAMRWVRSHAEEFGIDPERIAAGGGSAGGHLAAFTGLVDGTDDPEDDLRISPKPQALLLFNPVLDNGPDGGWGNQRVKRKTKEFSPAHNVSAAAPPTVVFLGTKDNLIPVATMERFRDNMKKAGVTCDLHLYEGEGHGFFNKEPSKADTVAKTEAFLRKLGWIE